MSAGAAYGYARPVAARHHQSGGRCAGASPHRDALEQRPVLLPLEEFPVLKHMEKLEAAVGQLAGSGVRLWVIVQNLGQLKRHYKEGWETFVANAGVITAFANADLETLNYLRENSAMCPCCSIEVRARLPQRYCPGRDQRKTTSARPRCWRRTNCHEPSTGQAPGAGAGGRSAAVDRRRMLYFKEEMFKGMFDE